MCLPVQVLKSRVEDGDVGILVVLPRRRDDVHKEGALDEELHLVGRQGSALHAAPGHAAGDERTAGHEVLQEAGAFGCAAKEVGGVARDGLS